MTSSKLNRDSIITDADYHTYSQYGLLSYYSDLEMNVDSLTNDYIPISATAQQGKNPKLFAVGVIPPSQEVTGRLLDRSASLAKGILQEVQTLAPAIQNFPMDEAYPATSNSKWNASTDLDMTFWVEYVQMCARIKQDPVALAAVIHYESGFNPASVNMAGGNKPVAKGLIQFTKKGIKGGAMTLEQWQTLETIPAKDQLPYVEKYLKGQRANKSAGGLYRVIFGGYNNPDGSLYASKAQQEAYIAAHPGAVFPNPDFQEKAVKQNGYVTNDPATGAKVIIQSTLDAAVSTKPSRAVKERIAAAKAFVDSGQTLVPTPIVEDAESNTAWLNGGSSDASRSAIISEYNQDYNLSAAGLSMQARQQAMIQAVTSALEIIKSTPPLRMLVNPSSFSVKSTKISNDGVRGRNGPIVEFWGDDTDKISGSGKLAAFYALDATNPNGVGGTTRMARNFSVSWQNFRSLWMLYKNNGAMYLSESLTQETRDLLISTVGSIYIYYDNTLYFGSFDSFNCTESDESPYTLEYSFEFTVRATFILDTPSDWGDTGQSLVKSQRTAAMSGNQVVSDVVEQNGSTQAASLLTSKGFL